MNIHHNENAKVLGGYMNECDGEYSIVLGGQYNECTSDYSVVIGGSDNQCHEPYSVVMGTQGIGAHSNTLLWNGSVNRSVMTTMASQCMLVSDNGLLFSTPKCSAILNSHIPEGMACVCWDPEERSMCVRSCQEGEYYKTFLTTIENHVQVKLKYESDGVRVSLQNADGTHGSDADLHD